MLIDQAKLKHWIENFYGYGSWKAKVWFVAYEEDGGEIPEDVADRINFFHSACSEQSLLCDIRELYRNVRYRNDGAKSDLFPDRYEYRFGTGASFSNVWKNLIAFEFAYRDEKEPDFLFYQRNVLASPEHLNEALIRLYPLPGPRSHAWYYAWLDMPELPFLKSRILYEQHLFKKRMDVLLSRMQEHKPEVVLMYGMDNINALKDLILSWNESGQFRMVKGSKMSVPQHHRIDLPHTTIVITTQFPALRHNRPETGFDWAKFGEAIRSKV